MPRAQTLEWQQIFHTTTISGKASMKCYSLIRNCRVITSPCELLVEREAVNTSHSYLKTVATHLGSCAVSWLIKVNTWWFCWPPRSELAANVRDCDTERPVPAAYRARSTLTYAGVPQTWEQKCHRPRGRRQSTCAGPATRPRLARSKPNRDNLTKTIAK